MSQNFCTSGAEITAQEVLAVCTDPNRSDAEKECAGCNASSVQDLTRIWTSDSLGCQYTLSQLLYPDGVNYSDENLSQVNADMLYLLQNQYRAQFGCTFDDTETDDDCKKFRDIMLGVCSNSKGGPPVPGICDNFLCYQLCPGVDYDSLGEDTTSANWCGCYVSPPDNVAAAITQQTQQAVVVNCVSDVTQSSDVGAFPCFPMCHRIATIGLFDPDNGCPYACNSNICVIDDVTIQAAESRVGSVNINQICPGCTLNVNETCECIISSENMTESFEQLGIDSQFNQYCGSNSVCYAINDAGQLDLVPCSNFVAGGPVDIFNIIPWVLVVVLIVFVLVIIAIMFFSRGKPKVTKVTVPAGSPKGENPSEPSSSSGGSEGSEGPEPSE